MERVYAEASPKSERVILKEVGVVASRDLLEVELQIESKSDYSYLAFGDIKHAGCEPLEVRRETYARSDSGYREYFDTMWHYVGFNFMLRKSCGIRNRFLH